MTEPPIGLTNDVLVRVLESAARLQKLVPDAVLVGGSAAALYAGHRSYDHDHVVADLAERFDTVLEAVESQDGWVTNRVTPGKIIPGELGGIETGIRQLIRRTPLDLASRALSDIDDYYADQHGAGDGVASQLVRQLADPRPKDLSTTRNLGQYKNLAARWQDWDAMVLACRELARAMLVKDGAS